MKRICNDSTTALVEDALGDVVEPICDFFCMRGDCFEPLPKNLEVPEQKNSLLKETGFELASETIRDDFLMELKGRRQNHSTLHA